jgi:hypothetical protein
METDTGRYARIGQSALRFVRTVRSDLKDAGLPDMTRVDFDRLVDRIVAETPIREDYRTQRAFRRGMAKYRRGLN